MIIHGKIEQSEIDDLNKWLEDRYGRQFDHPRYRVVWSDDQFEKRWVSATSEGIQLLNREVREVPKYKHYIRERYLLERLVECPIGCETDLTVNISYECIHNFSVMSDPERAALYPKKIAMEFVIETLEENMRNPTKNYVREKDSNERVAEEDAKRLKDIMDAIYGDETDLGDALMTKNAVIKPELWTGDNTKVE